MRRDAVATGEKQLGRFTAGKSKYIRLFLYNGKLTFAAMSLREVRVAGRSFTAGAPALTHVYTAGDYGTKHRRGPPVALLGAGVWRHAWGDDPRCPGTGLWRALPQHGPPHRVQ
jgi:hypothetical protein